MSVYFLNLRLILVKIFEIFKSYFSQSIYLALYNKGRKGLESHPRYFTEKKNLLILYTGLVTANVCCNNYRFFSVRFIIISVKFTENFG